MKSKYTDEQIAFALKQAELGTSVDEECRLALHLAGIDFEDSRIKSFDWPAMKEQMPSSYPDVHHSRSPTPSSWC